MGNKILCIIRTSTVHQETESQKQELIGFCKSKGFSPEDMIFIEVAGASARKCNQKYLAMLEDIKQAILSDTEIHNVALWHLNRLGRVESKLHEMKEFFVKNQIQVYVKEPNITLLDEDGSLSAAGSIAFSVYASMVKFETDEMMSKTKRGKERQRKLGKFIGGARMFGYKISPTKDFLIDEEEAKEVRIIFNLYSTGRYTLPELEKELNERGIKRDYFSIRKILSNERYISPKYPEIISEDLFNKCAEIRIKRAYPKTSPKKHEINLGVGIIKCGCGCNYARSTRHYLCGTALSKTNESCGAPSLKVETVESIIYLISRYGWLSEFLNKDSVNKSGIKDKIQVVKQKISHSKDEIQELRRRIEVLEDSYYIDGKMSEDKFNSRLQILEGKITVEEGKITSYNSELSRLNNDLKTTDSFSTAEKMFITLFEFRIDNNDREHMKDIKMFANSFLTSIRPYYIDDHKARKMKTVEIKVTDKYNNEWIFRYSPYIAAYKKDKCPLTMRVGTQFKAVLTPIREPLFAGNMEYNPEIICAVREKYGVPEVSMQDFREVLGKYYKK